MTTAREIELMLFGDLVRHVLLAPAGESAGSYDGFVREATNPLLPDMVSASLQEADPADTVTLRSLPNFDSPSIHAIKSKVSEIHTVLDYFPHKLNSDSKDPKVLRVRREHLLKRTHLSDGSAMVEKDQVSASTKVGEDQAFAATIKEEHRDFSSRGYIHALLEAKGDPSDVRPEHRIALVYDRNSLFREDMDKDAPRVALCSDIMQAHGGLVFAIADEISIYSLRKFSAAINAEPKFTQSIKPNSVAVVSADSLRKCGVPIMEYASIETSVNDVVKHLHMSPLRELSEICGHLVVIFRETGGLYIDVSGGEGSLSFCPNFDRYLQATPERFGAASGKFTIILTSILRELCRRCCDGGALNIAGALRLGTAAYNMHFKYGYTQSRGKAVQDPFTCIRDALSLKRREELRKQLCDLKKTEHFLTTLNFSISDAKKDTWCRYDCLRKSSDKKRSVFFDIPLYGLDYVFRDREKLKRMKESDKLSPFWYPEYVIKVPYAQFGKQNLVHWKEIEQFSSLAKLIGKYLGSPTVRMPLSIAVFGQPGSGKSFAVKQILKSVSPDRKSEPLTFNLAQFSSIDQLTEAFHKVQDRALALDETPLVIFDEFDCSFPKRLGWLKYFLAPMQDGMFRGRGEDYRVGRAIFLFAGGTSSTFKEFTEGLGQPAEAVQPRKEERAQSANGRIDSEAELKEVKLGDFVSRLRGYLDVGHINPTSEGGPDIDVQLRRAILLRSLLEEHARPIMKPSEDGPDEAGIDEAIVRSFLCVRRFNHGVRSMEAIIQMSRWIDGRFVPASLPAKDQLITHVHESFLRIMTESVRDTLDPSKST